MVGQQIGPYQILKLLGQGGMGIVYQGMHTRLEQLVAIKVLSPEFCENSTMRERFVQEAKLQVKLSHPNVVNILNYLEDNRNIYLIMEYVQGENLEALLRRSGPLPLTECCRITMGVLDALGFMHGQGIIHRDIKPSNIMITDSGQIKVTDFGIAKAAGEKGLTRTGTQLGTVWYMSPEQIRGAQVNGGSDIYALGVTLFQMATGEIPFHSDSDFDIMKAHVEQPPPDPEVLNPQISPVLAGLILKAMAKDCKDRFASAAEFKSALLYLELQGSSADSVISTGVRRESAAAGEMAVSRRADVASLEPVVGEHLIFGRLEKRTFTFLIAMAVVLLVLLIYFFSSSDLFKKEKKEPQHSIPLTSVEPEPTVPITSPDRGKAAETELPLSKPTREDVKEAQDVSVPVEEGEAGPQVATEDRTRPIATTAEKHGAVSDTLVQPLELVTSGGEKSPKEIFDEMFESGDSPPGKEAPLDDLLAKPHDMPQKDLTEEKQKIPEETVDQKKKATKKKSTRTQRAKKQTTKSKAGETSKGSPSASKSAKGESKGWAIIK